MKTHKVEFLEPSLQELREIENHYSAEFGVTSGKKLAVKIVKAIRKLKQFPYSGVLIRDKELSSQGYRTIFIDSFVVVYRIIEDVVYIYHIASTQTEYSFLFK